MPVYRVVITGLCFGQIHQNRLHFQAGNGGMELPDIATELSIQWTNSIRGLLMTEFKFTNIGVRNMTNPLEGSYNLTIDQAGTGGSVPGNPLAQCIVYRITTGTFGRTGRGRIFLGGVGNNISINGLVAGGPDGFYGAAWNNIRSKYLVGGTSELTLGVMTGDDVSTFKPALAITMSIFPGVQRRRRIGVGV
jgi:hypothetical protein